MFNITVAVVSLHITTNTLVWQIKRVAPGKTWMGWATGSGSFTPGIDPKAEAGQAEMFRTAQYAVDFAQEQGWQVVSVIER